MKIYSFFIKILPGEEDSYEFTKYRDYMFDPTYNGIHPIMKEDGCFYILYALTKEKDLADRFEETRKFGLFTKYSSNIPKEKYLRLVRNIDGIKLTVYNLTDGYTNQRQEFSNIHAVLAEHEISTIEDRDMIFMRLMQRVLSLKIYKDCSDEFQLMHSILSSCQKRLRKDLKKIYFDKMIPIFEQFNLVQLSEIDYLDQDIYYLLYDLVESMGGFNSFQVFMNFYGNTMEGL